MAIGTRSRGDRANIGDWLVPAGLIALSLIPAIAGLVRLADVASAVEVPANNARFLASPLPVVLHVLAATPYSLLGALQFSPAFRRRLRLAHVVVGPGAESTSSWTTRCPAASPAPR